MHPEIVHEAQSALGESPAWDVKTGTLYWVDILEKRVHYHHSDENGFIQLDEMPGSLAPCKDDTILLAARASILKLEPATANTTIVASITEPANNRFNDDLRVRVKSVPWTKIQSLQKESPTWMLPKGLAFCWWF